MRVGIILQARMGSTRLPGKVLKQLAEKPMLWHIIDRLKKVKRSDELIVATSENINDREVVELVRNCGISYFIGSEKDVLDRYYQAAKELQLEHIVRATADNPLVDPEEADKLIDLHLTTTADYSSNTSQVNSGLPMGIGVEVFSFAALEKSWIEGKNEDHREHVDEYILQNPAIFNIQVLQAPGNKRAPQLSLTVDTETDLRLMRDIYHRFYKPGHIVLVSQVIKHLAGVAQDSGKR
ncbi:cytidylyltransferase domain-containing protein [Chloroflexota bacterium]